MGGFSLYYLSAEQVEGDDNLLPTLLLFFLLLLELPRQHLLLLPQTQRVRCFLCRWRSWNKTKNLFGEPGIGLELVVVALVVNDGGARGRVAVVVHQPLGEGFGGGLGLGWGRRRSFEAGVSATVAEDENAAETTRAFSFLLADDLPAAEAVAD